MTLQTLIDKIHEKRSFLCVGLDTPDPTFAFNKKIIDATAPYAVAFKPNVAFYEAAGVKGIKSLEDTAFYIKTHYPDIFLIADAKRGDIGNTARQYARSFFENMPFDAVTLAPYMGFDSIEPFLQYEEKWAIVLALTSNPSATDFEMQSCQGTPLYKRVVEQACAWGGPDKMMFVAGATRPQQLREIRETAPNHFLLVPGIGAQGGSVEEVLANGRNAQGGLLINVSRSIIMDPEPGVAASKYADAFSRYF